MFITDTPAVEHSSGAEAVGQRERAPQPPLYQRCSNSCFGPAAIRLEPVVALLDSLIATAT